MNNENRTNENRISLVQAFSNSVRGVDSSKQLALGVAVGMMAGLVPKENLIFVGLLVFLVVSGANLLTGLVSVVVSSVASPHVDSIFHFAGSQILSTDFATRIVSGFLELPFASWTELNNTVVCGSMFIGLAFVVPLYFVSFGLFHHFRTPIKNWSDAIFVQSAVRDSAADHSAPINTEK